MPVVSLTVAIGLCLAFAFILFFLREHMRGRLGSIERDAAPPLAEEALQLVPASAPDDSAPHGCGCHNGSRPPCPGCLRRGARVGSVSD